MFGLGFLFRLIGRLIGFVIKAVVFLAALATVAAGVMYAMFDAEAFKRELSQRVVDVTGRTLAIDSAELRMGLPPKLVLNDVRLSNARWGSRPDMALRRHHLSNHRDFVRPAGPDNGCTTVGHSNAVSIAG